MKFCLSLMTAIVAATLGQSTAAPAASAEVVSIESFVEPPIQISPVPINIEERAFEDSSDLAKRSATKQNAAVLFPAYIYPSSWTSPPAWQPLYTAVSSYPNTFFHIVINPNSGPGGASPDSDYATAIKTLRKYPNVILLGYVHTSWGTRSSNAVYADIQAYAGWRAQGYSMDGIFFDEAPTQATDTLYNYMANITCYAKESITSTLYGNLAMIYFNPGAVPDTRYYTLADFIAIFEDTYANYLTAEATFAPGTSLTMSKSNFMIHSMNASWTLSQMTSFVNSLTNGDKLGSVFLTDVSSSSNPYGQFGADWSTFVAAVASLN